MQAERPQAERQEKHLALSEAIDGLESVQVRIDQILSHIQGAERVEAVAPPSAPAAKAPSQPSLFEVLENGASRLHDKREAALKVLCELENVLF